MSISFVYPSQLMPTLVLFGDLLEPELRMLPHVLGPGRTAVDVGGSIGTWTMSAARTGATVHVCEPDLVNLESLAANCQDNHLQDLVTVHRMGLSSTSGSGTVEANPRRYLNSVRVHEGAGVQPGPVDTAGQDQFPVLTLDEFVAAQGLEHIDVLKINTAGGEADVVRGGTGLLRRGGVDLIMVLDGLRVRPLLDEIAEFGYDVGFWDGRQARFTPVSSAAGLDGVKRGPMNRYVLLRRRQES
jgi:FkbM family methyltransferase